MGDLRRRPRDADAQPAGRPAGREARERAEPAAALGGDEAGGEERGRGNSGTIHWKFEDMIAHISQSETLYPGEFIGSGTVGGGCGLEIERYLEDGDVIELEVEGIGILRNRVVKG